MRQNRKRDKKYAIGATVVAMVGIAAIAGIYLWPGASGQAGDGGEAVASADKSLSGIMENASEYGSSMESADLESLIGESNSERGQADEFAAEPETDEPEENVVEITISAVGDLTLGHNQTQSYDGSFDAYYDSYGADYFFRNVKEIFAADDCTIGNLEGTLTDSENIRTTKEWNHKGRPEYAKILTEGSVEVVSLGNNHIMDYNEEGVSDTFSALENVGVTYAISGTWGDQYGLYETEKGIKIGFVSVNEYYEGNAVYAYLEEGLAMLREEGADLVFALLHWGGDKTHVIEDDQYTMGRWCIDQGYDLVLGCHPHVLQGIECYKGKYIVYSMGNFCYGGNKNPTDKETMIFQQTFTFADGILQEDTSTIRAIPCRLSSTTSTNDYCPVVLTGDEAAEVIANLNAYSEEFGIAFDADGYLLEDGRTGYCLHGTCEQ